MGTQTNDPNPQGTKWWHEGIYGEKDTIYPEEDYQMASLPVTTLIMELQRRCVHGYPAVEWQGKTIDFSAVTDNLLMHHISIHLANSGD